MLTTCVRNLSRWLQASLLLGAAASVQAAVPQPVADNILAKLKAARADWTFMGVEESPVDGMYRVQVENGPLLFVSKDGQYFLTGDMYQVKPGEFVNLQELERSGMRKEIMATLAPEDQIIFKAKGDTKTVVHVFTDVDCGYCRKLHREIEAINNYGIEVRYLAYPRAGIPSESYDKLATAWCASNPQAVLTKLKQGEAVEMAVCEDNPVAMAFRLGNMIGVRGTPALVLEDGTILPGYLPAEELAQRLGVL